MSDEPDLSEQLRHRVADGVATLTINRPDRGNAITAGVRDRMIELLRTAGGSLAVRAVVLRAEGRFFCTGADLRADRPAEDRPADAPERAVGESARMIREGAQALIAAVQDCDKPVLASVNGTAAGLGAHLVLASDLVVASDRAKLIEIFARRGLVPDGGGAYLLTRELGLHRAKELVFFADDVPAADAERLGLFNKVVPHDELGAETDTWAARLAAGPTQSFAIAKRLLNEAGDQDRRTAFDAEAMGVELALGSEDTQEGVAAFVERRDPTFRGW